MIWKIIAGAGILIGMLIGVGGVAWGTATTFASKDDLAQAVVEISGEITQVAGDVKSNRLLILNDRMAEAQREKRGYERRREAIPPALIEWIRQLREQIEAEKRR